MANKRKLIVEVVGDWSKLSRGLKDASGSAKAFDRSMKVSLGSLAKLGVAIGGFAALTSALRTGAEEFLEQQKVAAQTQAVLKSTGATAGVTARQVDQLSTAISNYSGIDDEAVQSSQNLLLTFTDIKNRVGKGNDVFTQATKAVADLSTAMGIDATNAALQVGKALNDPERGYARLQRIGVAFSKTQVQMIKGFEASGDTMSAQKVILAELTREFGGSAKAFGQSIPGQLARLREAFRNIGGSIIGAVAKPFASALEEVNRFVGRLSKAQGVRAKFNVVFDGLQNIGQRLLDLVDQQLRRVDFAATVSAVQDKLAEGLRQVGEAVGRVDFSAVGQQVGQALAAGMQGATTFLRSVDWSQVGSGIVNGIRAFLAGVNWKTVAVATIKLLVAAFKAQVEIVKGIGTALGQALFDAIKAGLEWVGQQAERLAYAVVIKILSPFNKKLFGHSIVPGLDALIGSMKTKMKELETAGGQGAKAAADAISSPLSQLAKQSQGGAATKPVPIPIVPVPTVDGPSASEIAERARKAFERLFTSLSINVDKASLTKPLDDDLAAVRRIIGALRERARLVKDDLSVQQRLVSALGQQKQLMEQQAQQVKENAQNAREARDSRQFRRLGLSASGDTITPGAEALGRQLNSIGDQVAGTFLDTGKTQALLDRIRAVLGGGLGKLSEEVRAKIKELLDGIKSQLADAGKQGGPLTKTTALNTDRILEGLGLSPGSERALRGRLSRFNSAGTALAGSGSGSVAVTVPVSVQIDGRQVAKASAKYDRRARSVNPTQRNGPHPGGR